MKEILLEVWIQIKDKKDAKDIAHDIHEILNDCGVTNSVVVTDR